MDEVSSTEEMMADIAERERAWEKRMKEFFARLKHPRLRILVETLYDFQKLRMATNSRMVLYDKFNLLTPLQSADLSERVQELKMAEGRILKMVEDELEGEPIWTGYLKEIKGIGPAMAGGLIAWIDDIARFGNISKLWAYAVGKPGEKKRRGERVGYNPRLKTHCWKIGGQLLKARNERYREVYDEAKTKYGTREDIREQHEKLVKVKARTKSAKASLRGYKLHLHLMALRKMVKQFLADLWIRWREMEGLPVSKPYIIEKLGHTGYIEPPKVQ